MSGIDLVGIGEGRLRRLKPTDRSARANHSNLSDSYTLFFVTEAKEAYAAIDFMFHGILESLKGRYMAHAVV